MVLRLKEDQDGAEPSANSISSLNLLRLFAYTENKKYREMAGQLFNSYETTLTRFPVALPALTSGLLMFHKSPLQIIIAGPEKEAKPLIEAVHKLLLPQKILIRAPAENAQETSMIYKVSLHGVVAVWSDCMVFPRRPRVIITDLYYLCTLNI